MSNLVIDASIAIKWVIEEEGTKEALALRRQALAAPDLLIAECANVLWQKVRRRGVSDQEAQFTAGLLARADIDLVPMRPYLEAAVRIALALDHAAYDCLHPFGRSREFQFITADTGLLRKVARRASGRYANRVLGLTEARA